MKPYCAGVGCHHKVEMNHDGRQYLKIQGRHRPTPTGRRHEDERTPSGSEWIIYLHTYRL